MLSQPSFLLVKQGNGVLRKLIHGLAGPSLDVLLDHFFQLRPRMNLHGHILPILVQKGEKLNPLREMSHCILPVGHVSDPFSNLFYA